MYRLDVPLLTDRDMWRAQKVQHRKIYQIITVARDKPTDMINV